MTSVKTCRAGNVIIIRAGNVIIIQTGDVIIIRAGDVIIIRAGSASSRNGPENSHTPIFISSNKSRMVLTDRIYYGISDILRYIFAQAPEDMRPFHGECNCYRGAFFRGRTAAETGFCRCAPGGRLEA
jgi:hypothetical protein